MCYINAKGDWSAGGTGVHSEDANAGPGKRTGHSCQDCKQIEHPTNGAKRVQSRHASQIITPFFNETNTIDLWSGLNLALLTMGVLMQVTESYLCHGPETSNTI